MNGPARRPDLALLAALVAAGAGMYRGLALPLNHDAAWLLHLSARVLDGERLYVDLIEVNPPLIIWLGMPVIAIERATGVAHTIFFPVLVVVTAVISLWGAYRYSADVLSEPYRSAFLAALAVALFPLASGVWGQREHLMVILAVPYVVACAARARGVRPRGAWVSGIAAGVGFAIKPHFLLLPLALEAWLLLIRRRPWNGAFIVAGTVTIYGLAALVFAPEYIPMMLDLRDAYAAFINSPLAGLILRPVPILVALTIPLVLIPGEGRELRFAFAIAAVAWCVIAIAQGKGFWYHYVPAVSGAVVLASLALIGLSSLRERPTLGAAAPLIFAALALAQVVGTPPSQSLRWERVREVVEIIGDRDGEHDALILSVAVGDSWPGISYSSARWTLALPSLWPARPEVGATRYAAMHAVRALRERPVVLAPNDSRYDGLPALLGEPAFRAAWDGYVQTDNLEYYRVFRPRPD